MDTQDRKTFTLLTFLGRGGYDEVFYVWKGRKNERQTKFVAESIADLVGDVEKVIACATEEVKNERKYTELKEALKNKVRETTIVNIPSGKDEAEIWQIFDSIVSALSGEQNVIIDITHGFRSLPMIVFSVADYLRKVESVTIRYILYGAYDAGESCSNGIKSVPIFDLTPLLDLMEWTGGLEAFLKRGEADLIGEKMRDKQRILYRQRDLYPSLPQKLQSVGEKLKTLSLSLHLARPKEVLKDAHDLLNLLTEAKNELNKWAKPFAAIVDRVQKELEAFAYGDAGKLTRENLEKQRALLEYYRDKGLMIQTALLAREWMVSYVIYRHYGKCTDWNKKEKREEAENHLNRDKSVPAADSSGNMLPDDLLDCWKSLADLRNDLAHCGMRENPRPAKDIESQLKSIVDKILSIKLT